MKTKSTPPLTKPGTPRAGALRENGRAARRWLPVAGLFMAGITLAAWLASQALAGKAKENTVDGEARRGSSPASASHQTAAPLPTTTPTLQHSTSPLPELLQKLAAAHTAADKRALADTLIALGTEEALQAWGKALLAETDPAARRAMLEALDTLNGEAAVEMITQLIELSDAPEIVEAVTRTLSRMANPETVAYLAELHASGDPALQQRVLGVLGSISNPTAVPGLIRLAHQPALGTELTGQAFTSLGKIGDSASLLAMSSAYDTILPENFAQRQQILQSIATIRNPASRAMLEDLAANSTQPLIAATATDALRNLPAATSPLVGDASAMPSPQELIAK
ncbi:MAG: HEAT repeat domain-containing protein [Verrucomicrobiaceae bacterium]|nr:HEAT repeat domain-containing protein [Verrucomicrobiaceae bacterium]